MVDPNESVEGIMIPQILLDILEEDEVKFLKDHKFIMDNRMIIPYAFLGQSILIAFFVLNLNSGIVFILIR